MTTIPDNAIETLMTNEQGLKKNHYRGSLKIYSELLGIKETSVEYLLSCIYRMVTEDMRHGDMKIGFNLSKRYRDAYERLKANGTQPGNYIVEIIEAKLTRRGF
jgi:hypothetical protein